MSSLLLATFLLPLFGILLVSFLPEKYIWDGGLISSFLTFILSLFLWVFFDNSTGQFQGLTEMVWDRIPGLANTVHLTFGIDGISILLVILTTFLIPICLLSSMKKIQQGERDFIRFFLLLEFFCIGAFTLLDLLFFYVFFEGVLIPMFIIIGVWGSRERKIRAAYQLFIYTLLGSVFMLLAILLLYFEVGTTDYQVLLSSSSQWSEKRQILLWLAFFASFAVKVPMVPFHLWLPEAHVEAPTAGSVILAGILLKLGTYGFLRFSIPLLPTATIYFTPWITTLSVIGIMYASLTTLRQIDLKKIIAYSSVGHMSVVILGLYSLNIQGLEGSLLLMLGHGIVSGALFLMVGLLYDRTHTRNLKYYGGLTQLMPMYALLFLFFTLANMGLPGLSNFVGEFLIFTGIFQLNTLLTLLASTGIILGGAYSIWLANRLLFGQQSSLAGFRSISVLMDLTLQEFLILLPFVFLVFWMGIYPEVFLKVMHATLSTTLSF